MKRLSLGNSSLFGGLNPVTLASTFLLLCSASRARVAIRSWLRFCSVMSRAIFDAPTILPCAFLTGETVSETTMRLTSEDLKRAIEGRIQALANVHSLFVESRWVGADLSTIAAQELGPYSVQGRVGIEGPAVFLEPNTAQAFAVSLHELATNAAKYGSLSQNKGQVGLKWVHGADRELVLRWIETGGPPVEPPTRKGFGSRVIVG